MSFAYEFAEKESSDHLRSNTKATFRPRNMLTGEAAAVCSKVGKQHTSETHVKMVEIFKVPQSTKVKSLQFRKRKRQEYMGTIKFWLVRGVLYCFRFAISKHGSVWPYFTVFRFRKTEVAKFCKSHSEISKTSFDFPKTRFAKLAKVCKSRFEISKPDSVWCTLSCFDFTKRVSHFVCQIQRKQKQTKYQK